MSIYFLFKYDMVSGNIWCLMCLYFLVLFKYLKVCDWFLEVIRLGLIFNINMSLVYVMSCLI